MFIMSAILSPIDESKLKLKHTKLQLKKIMREVSSRSYMLSILAIIALTGFALSTNVIEVITPLVFVDNGINELQI